MSHKFDPAKKHKLDNPWRRQNMPPLPTLEALGLVEDDTVADIGCGIGYFSIPAAQRIHLDKKVYALDTSQDMLEELEKRATDQSVPNIITIKTDEYDLKLAEGKVDFALIVNVLHEIDNKERFLSEVHRILNSSGRVAIVEWQKKETEMGPPVNHRLDQNDVISLLKSCSFQISKELEFAGALYGIVACR